jgi:NAD(P)-dependent dehydrogenase (short-subunit alcohol dehydrogenase family)
VLVDSIPLEGVAESIRGVNANALVVPTDMRDAEQVERLVATTVARFGRLDLAFNNAGSGHRPAPLADLTVQDFDEAISLNLRGMLVAMKYEIAAMLASGGGAIVNMSSTAGLSGVRGMSAYCATKHAVIGATNPRRSTMRRSTSASMPLRRVLSPLIGSRRCRRIGAPRSCAQSQWGASASRRRSLPWWSGSAPTPRRS